MQLYAVQSAFQKFDFNLTKFQIQLFSYQGQGSVFYSLFI